MYEDYNLIHFSNAFIYTMQGIRLDFELKSRYEQNHHNKYYQNFINNYKNNYHHKFCLCNFLRFIRGLKQSLVRFNVSCILFQ